MISDLFPCLFSIIGIKYNKFYLDKIISDTPYINTMFGVCMVLSKYNLKYECIDTDGRKLFHSGEKTGIILLDRNFVIIQETNTPDEFLITESSGKFYSIELSELLRIWDNKIIYVNKTATSHEPDYREHLKFRYLNMVKAAILSAGIFMYIAINIDKETFSGISRYLLIAINTAGIFITYLLLRKQWNLTSKISNAICGLIEKSGCDHIASSESNSFLGIAKFSEIGFVFFCVNLGVLLISGRLTTALSIVSICVLPFSFWSIWYQHREHSWCTLCLISLSLMWLQAITFAASGAFRGISPDISSVLELIALYCIFTISLNLISILYEKYMKASVYASKYNELKFNGNVISATERNAPAFDTSSQACSSLVFGNADSQYNLTVFSNPYCNPCASMHKRIDDINNGNISVRYVFTFFNWDLSAINKYFIAAYQQLGAEKCREIMNEWYGGDKTAGEDFFKKYNLDITTDEVRKEFEKQLEWSKDDNLKGTPTIILNGREIIAPYEVEDYRFIV